MNSRKIKKVLITGGAGFIGSAVVRQFINETDFKVVNVDALTYARNSEKGSVSFSQILRLAQERNALHSVVGQIGRSAAWPHLIAKSTAHVIRQSKIERSGGSFQSGIYQLAAACETSWFGFAQAIGEQARRLPDLSLALNGISPHLRLPNTGATPHEFALGDGRTRKAFRVAYAFLGRCAATQSGRI